MKKETGLNPSQQELLLISKMQEEQRTGENICDYEVRLADSRKLIHLMGERTKFEQALDDGDLSAISKLNQTRLKIKQIKRYYAQQFGYSFNDQINEIYNESLSL